MKVFKMIINKEGKPEIECITCFNNGKICPCCIYYGNPELPNLYNNDFNKKIIKTKDEGIYEAKL